MVDENGVHGGQSLAEDIVTLSELLDMQIAWHDEPKKPDNSFKLLHILYAYNPFHEMLSVLFFLYFQ